MYVKPFLRTPSYPRLAIFLWSVAWVGLQAISADRASAQTHVIQRLTQSSQRLEMTTNTSRILTMEKRIPRMVVTNPELVTVTALSANQIQLAARKPGVTQVNLWDEDGQIYTVDVLIYGDVRELEHALKRLFPASSVNVMRLTNSLVLEGFVDRPEAVSPMVRLAEDYAPKVINNMTVGGVQQVLLKVKVMEVSRTKLRKLGFDFGQFSSGGHFASGVSGLLGTVTGGAATAVGQTAEFAVFDGSDSFFGFLDMLQQNNLSKILADPSILAISGRPAHFNVGGELPIIIPSGLGQTTVEYKKFGTQVDFVPIVLGNGNIRLEVRPRVSEIDDTRSVTIDQFTVPALKVREVDTAVELKAGQTLALAGLVQTRVEAQERGLPFLSDLPYLGAAFRSVQEEVNEIELLILVTPEFVDGLQPHEVPTCGPGMESISPTNRQLYFGGHLEVPNCGPCGPAAGGPWGSGCVECQVGTVGAPARATDTESNIFQTTTPAAQNPRIPSSTPATHPVQESGGGAPTAPTAGKRLPRTTGVTAFRPQNSGNQQNRPARRPVTNTPGLIGPLGYDTGN